jgi:CopG-like RHH_1 or ribbon-helix-helix domain, RHH_5
MKLSPSTKQRTLGRGRFVGITLPPNLHEAAQAYATQESRSLSNLIRIAVEAYLIKHAGYLQNKV